MITAGDLERLSRGVYRHASLPLLSDPDLTTVALRIPRGVICLISALAFHHLTIEVPQVVDVAVRRGTEPPRLKMPPVRSYQVSEPAFSRGVETRRVDGVSVRIYGPAKTVADCFKFRHKIGVDVALDGLKRYLACPDASMDALLGYARVDRVERVLRPYLEALA